MPQKEIAKDRIGECKHAIVLGPGEVAEDAFCLIPMELGGGTHLEAWVIDDRGYVRASAARKVKEFADEFREGGCFGVERDKEGGFRRRFGGHGVPTGWQEDMPKASRMSMMYWNWPKQGGVCDDNGHG